MNIIEQSPLDVVVDDDVSSFDDTICKEFFLVKFQYLAHFKCKFWLQKTRDYYGCYRAHSQFSHHLGCCHFQIYITP